MLGWGLILAPFLVLLPFVGGGTGKSYESGSDAARHLSLTVLLDNPSAITFLVLLGVGIVLVGASFIVRR